MLRHLGAAYYQTIHGDGTASQVARALESAEAADGRRPAGGASRVVCKLTARDGAGVAAPVPKW